MKEIVVYIQVANASNLPEATESLPQIQIIQAEYESRNRTIGREFLTRAIITAAENLEEGINEGVFLKAKLWTAWEKNSPGSEQRRIRTTGQGDKETGRGGER